MKSKFGNSTATTSGSDTAFLVFFVLFILLLITLPTGGYCYANRDAIKIQIEKVKKDSETFVSTSFKGAKDIKFLSNDDRLDGEDCCVFLLAPWCGHCKRLKESGTLEVLSKDVPVRVLDDKHPDTSSLMKELKSQGFPTIGMMKSGKLMNYEGPREADSIKQSFMN
jgi:thiol-disulfide isomerase/thioredoxin